MIADILCITNHVASCYLSANLWLIYFNYSSGQKWCPEGDISLSLQVRLNNQTMWKIFDMFLNIWNMKEKLNTKIGKKANYSFTHPHFIWNHMTFFLQKKENDYLLYIILSGWVNCISFTANCSIYCHFFTVQLIFFLFFPLQIAIFLIWVLKQHHRVWLNSAVIQCNVFLMNSHHYIMSHKFKIKSTFLF